MFEAAVGGFGGAIAGAGMIEVGQDLPGSAFECSSHCDNGLVRKLLTVRLCSCCTGRLV